MALGLMAIIDGFDELGHDKSWPYSMCSIGHDSCIICMRVAVRGKNLDLERNRRREPSCVAMRDAHTVLLHADCEDVSASARILGALGVAL